MVKREDAFTLIEMIIVLAVITILMLLLIPNLSKRNEDIHVKGDEAMIQLATSQVQAYLIDNGEYPSSVAKLVNEDYLQTDILPSGKKKMIFKDLNSYEIITVDIE
ncbi:competence type IV pilus major pilin ComGC [Amphibacillus sediminis]|uniref:competence type IV pilus major pilin ComGC n=1 Tax=Amphibacillus sediminis TaxID=360185 RepID=UPI0008325EB2|nr:competence type IV pilus major pilin ComGC [Amphibacillus sediminis]